MVNFILNLLNDHGRRRKFKWLFHSDWIAANLLWQPDIWIAFNYSQPLGNSFVKKTIKLLQKHSISVESKFKNVYETLWQRDILAKLSWSGSLGPKLEQ